jgi:anti-anti-sigma factor
MSVDLGPSSRDACALSIEGPLRAPVHQHLRHRVRSLIRDGERAIIVDLARVSTIDAAGVGELVRAYNMTSDVNAVLRIAHATVWVREMLERAGLFDLLSAERTAN